MQRNKKNGWIKSISFDFKSFPLFFHLTDEKFRRIDWARTFFLQRFGNYTIYKASAHLYLLCCQKCGSVVVIIPNLGEKSQEKKLNLKLFFSSVSRESSFMSSLRLNYSKTKEWIALVSKTEASWQCIDLQCVRGEFWPSFDFLFVISFLRPHTHLRWLKTMKTFYFTIIALNT